MSNINNKIENFNLTQDLKDHIEDEKIAQEELDEVIYNILDLSKEEKKLINKGLKELIEIRRLRSE